MKTILMIITVAICLLATAGQLEVGNVDARNRQTLSRFQFEFDASALASKCEPTKNIDLKNRTISGEGCTQQEAKEVAKSKLVSLCSGENDPKCTASACTKENKHCQAVLGSTSGETYGYGRTKTSKCGRPGTWVCILTVKDMGCGCACKD
jgi:hypothetical protein